MTMVIDPPARATAVLFGSSDATRALEDTLRDRGIIGSVAAATARLSGNVRGALQNEVATTMAGLLDLDLIDVLAAAWRKHSALTAAAQRTVATPGSSEVVELATHRVTSVHRPYVDVIVDDVHVGRINTELRLVFVLAGVVAVVRGGELVGIRSGHCTADAILTIEGVDVARRTARFDLPPIVRVDLHVPLLAAAA